MNSGILTLQENLQKLFDSLIFSSARAQDVVYSSSKFSELFSPYIIKKKQILYFFLNLESLFKSRDFTYSENASFSIHG